MSERAVKPSLSEGVSADPVKGVTTERRPPSGSGVEQLGAIAARPVWSVDVDPPRLRCQWEEGCDLEAVACVVALEECYCRRHARAFRQEHPDRRIVPLVDCARCGRQSSYGLALRFEGEDVQRLCRGCGELVRDLVEGEK